MPYFGDVSGDLRGLLQDHCKRCVVAVVGGSRTDCYRCPKRSVRNVTDIPEARWNDLTYVQKRRLFECFEEYQDDLAFGIAVFTKNQLQSIENYHLLYTDEGVPPNWDIALQAFAYFELVTELWADRAIVDLTFDRVASQQQSEQLASYIMDLNDRIVASAVSSRQSAGVQAADCVAGAVNEQLSGGEPWLEYIGGRESIVDRNFWALMQLEAVLYGE